jgi:hypothetical protein
MVARFTHRFSSILDLPTIMKKTGRIVVAAALLTLASTSYAQQTFDKRLNLDTCSRFGDRWGVEVRRWEFRKEKPSAVSEDVWDHFIAKSTSGNNKVILTRKELDYFIGLQKLKATSKGPAIANPAEWETKLGKNIQSFDFDKPLYALVISKGKLVKLAIRSISGVAYHTLYPSGAAEDDIPVVYKLEYMFDTRSPFILVTSAFLEKVKIDRAIVKIEQENFGTKTRPGVLHKIGIDFNGDGQPEVQLYDEEMKDFETPEGDEGGAYRHYTLAIYSRQHWYRTSYWQNGQDGVEGF